MTTKTDPRDARIAELTAELASVREEIADLERSPVFAPHLARRRVEARKEKLKADFVALIKSDPKAAARQAIDADTADRQVLLAAPEFPTLCDWFKTLPKATVETLIGGPHPHPNRSHIRAAILPDDQIPRYVAVRANGLPVGGTKVHVTAAVADRLQAAGLKIEAPCGNFFGPGEITEAELPKFVVPTFQPTGVVVLDSTWQLILAHAPEIQRAVNNGLLVISDPPTGWARQRLAASEAFRR